jgi:hypothetical protein
VRTIRIDVPCPENQFVISGRERTMAMFKTEFEHRQDMLAIGHVLIEHINDHSITFLENLLREYRLRGAGVSKKDFLKRIHLAMEEREIK